jgi:hypothetical protein
MAENSTSTSRPRRKVTVGILAGSIIVVIVWVLKTFANIQVTSEVAAALTTILSFAISYLTPPDPDETSITDAQGKTISALKSAPA